MLAREEKLVNVKAFQRWMDETLKKVEKDAEAQVDSKTPDFLNGYRECAKEVCFFMELPFCEGYKVTEKAYRDGIAETLFYLQKYLGVDLSEIRYQRIDNPAEKVKLIAEKIKEELSGG